MDPEQTPQMPPPPGPAAKSTSLSYFLIALAVVIALAAVLIWVQRSREIRDRDRQEQVDQPGGGKDPGTLPNGDGKDPAGLDPDRPDPVDIDKLRFGSSPDALMEQMTKALNDLDMEQFNALSGGTIDEKTLQALRDYASSQKALGRQLRLREVGETDLNKGSRWAIESGADGDTSRVYIDMTKGEKGWEVGKVTLPGSNPDAVVGADPLFTAEAFLLAVLSQNFEEARKHVDGGKVSDARIAGLCILFEEGKYELRQQKPLRAMLMREDFASYLANVVATDGTEAGQFGLNLTRKDQQARWMVNEIVLDRLLADYAQRVAGGDVYYSPLVRNPEGGDTLALYFGFDEDEISPRTQRQLEIVAAILKSDKVKKLTLSGHTDSKGTDDYNKGLSMRRAEVVKQFLIDAGVEAGQVVTIAKGDTQPRRPNVTETGADNPEGRRANRRTEIYLDF